MSGIEAGRRETGGMGKSGRKPRVTDDEILDVFQASDQPVMTPKQVAAELSIKRRGLHNRLVDLEEQGVLERMDVGPTGSVWWIADDVDRDGN